MFFMGVGGFVQKYINDANLIEKFINIEILLAVFGSFAPIAVYAVFGYFDTHFNILFYFFVSIIGFLVGLEIPFVARINQNYTTNLKSNIAFIISADYVGAFIGAIVWVKFLLPHVHIFKIGFLISGLNFFVAFITFLYFKKHLTNIAKFIYFVLFFLVSVLLLYGYNSSENYDKILEQRLYEDKIIFSKTTKYQHISFTYNKQLNDYRLYLNGNLQFSSLDEVRYHELLVHPAMNLAKKTENILVLGGGDGLAAREIQKYNPQNITIVDLDPQMTYLAKNNNIFKKLNNNSLLNTNIKHVKPNIKIHREKDNFVKNKDNNKTNFLSSVNVYNIDAMNYLNKIKNTVFDVVIIDLPDPNNIELAKLYTKEFYLSLKNVIHIDTVLAIQSSSSYFAKEVFLAIGRTIQSASYKTIAYHHNIPSFGEWGFYLFSLNKGLKTNLNLNVKTAYITNDIFTSSLVFGKNDLKTDKTYVNTLMNPVLFYEYQNNSWLKY